MIKNNLNKEEKVLIEEIKIPSQKIKSFLSKVLSNKIWKQLHEKFHKIYKGIILLVIYYNKKINKIYKI